MRGLPELNWLERLIGLDFTSNVVEAWGNLDDDTLKLLPHFVDLQSLTLRGNGITDCGLATLSACPKIRRLSLDNCSTSNQGIEYLGKLLSLEVLTLSNLPILDSGLAVIAGLPNLRTLILANLYLTAEGLSALKLSPKLETLVITESMVYDAAFKDLHESKGLSVVRVYKCPLLTDNFLAYLGQIKSLRRLEIEEPQLTANGLAYLEKFDGLEDLFVTSRATSNDDLAHVAKLRNSKDARLPLRDVHG